MLICEIDAGRAAEPVLRGEMLKSISNPQPHPSTTSHIVRRREGFLRHSCNAGIAALVHSRSLSL